MEISQVYKEYLQAKKELDEITGQYIVFIDEEETPRPISEDAIDLIQKAQDNLDVKLKAYRLALFGE
jgi:hypothetical protein